MLRYHYPSGRVYYTPLRMHMKELVDELIADATKEGFKTTRQKPGPKHVPDPTLLGSTRSYASTHLSMRSNRSAAGGRAARS